MEERTNGMSTSLSEEDIAEVIAGWTGIPLTKINETESEKLLSLEDTLHERVIGQKDAVNSISKAVRRARAGLKDPKRPLVALSSLDQLVLVKLN